MTHVELPQLITTGRCPYCGCNEGCLVGAGSYTAYSVREEDVQYYRVRCNNPACNAQGPKMPSVQDAVRAWEIGSK